MLSESVAKTPKGAGDATDAGVDAGRSTRRKKTHSCLHRSKPRQREDGSGLHKECFSPRYCDALFAELCACFKEGRRGICMKMAPL